MSDRQFTFEYTKLLADIMSFGIAERNERTGQEVKVARGSRFFSLDLSNNILPVLGLRKMRPKTAAIEVAWFVSGRSNVGWLEERGCKIWSKFAEKNNPRHEDGAVLGAYGFRWRHAFGRDQLALAVDLLRQEPSSRHALISAWDPRVDGLGQKAKNFPCPSHFTLSITGEELHSSLFVRSSDVVVGLPYDVMGHALLMRAIGIELDRPLGMMSITLANVHVYKAHYEMATQLMRENPMYPRLQMPDCSLDFITKKPDEYIAKVYTSQESVWWSSYDPKPELMV